MRAIPLISTWISLLLIILITDDYSPILVGRSTLFLMATTYKII